MRRAVAVRWIGAAGLLVVLSAPTVWRSLRADGNEGGDAHDDGKPAATAPREPARRGASTTSPAQDVAPSSKSAATFGGRVVGAATLEGANAGAVELVLRSDTHAAADRTTTTFDDGSFAFEDLPDGFAGVLSWPAAYEGVAPTPARALAAAAGDPPLRIDLRRTPVVRGRVVLADGETPAADVEARLAVSWRMAGATFAARADENGAFEAPLAKCPSSGEPPVAARLSIVDASGAVRAERDVAGDFRDSIDLGRVRLFATPETRVVRVVDEDGRPVANAAAVVDGGAILRTDAEGRVELPWSDGARFGAVGLHRTNAVFREAPTDAPSKEIVVRMKRCGALTIAAPKGRRVRASSSGLLTTGPLDAAFRATTEGEVLFGARSGDEGVVALAVGDGGRVVLPEIVVGSRVRVDLLAATSDLEGAPRVVATCDVVVSDANARVEISD
jgi:hypothetical protein